MNLNLKFFFNKKNNTHIIYIYYWRYEAIGNIFNKIRPLLISHMSKL